MFRSLIAWIAAALAWGVALATAPGLLAAFGSAPGPAAYVFRSAFDDGERAPPELVEASGEWGRRGLEAPAHGVASARLRFPVVAPTRVQLRAWTYPGLGLRGSLSVEVDGRTVLERNDPLFGESFDLADAVAGSGSFDVVVRAENPLDVPALVLDQVDVSQLRPEDLAWPLDRGLAALALGAALALVLRGRGVRSARAWLAGGLCAAVAAAASALGLGLAWIVAPLLGLALLEGLGLLRGRAGSATATRVALLAVLVLAFAWRWEALREVQGFELDPDAIMYRLYALAMTPFGERGFYSARFSEREPLYIAWLWLVFRLLGSSALHVRLASLLLALVWIGASYGLGRRAFGNRAAGVAVAALVAFHPTLVVESVRGLRTELLGSCATILGTVVFFGRAPRRWCWLVAGAAGGAFALVHITGLWISALALALAAGWRGLHLLAPQRVALPAPIARWTPLCAGGALLIATLLFAPHVVSTSRIHGDPFWNLSSYARINANAEFRERHGEAGFPTPEEFAASSYAGPALGYTEYLFDLHEPRELVTYTLRGTVLLYGVAALAYIPRVTDKVLVAQDRGAWAELLRRPEVLAGLPVAVAMAVGWFLCLARGGLAAAPLFSLLCIAHVAMLYDRQLVEPYRHTLHMQSFLALGAVAALPALWRGRAAGPV